MDLTQEHVEITTKAFFDAIAQACRRIVLYDDNHPQVTVTPSEYVIPGCLINIATNDGDFPFWIGLNGPRIFFIAYVGELSAVQARETYKFTFGGAAKVGWSINCEDLSGGVSIWGTLEGSFDRPLANVTDTPGEPAKATLTRDGAYWATDIAMMAQSWVRTSQRANVSRHDRNPAPL